MSFRIILEYHLAKLDQLIRFKHTGLIYEDLNDQVSFDSSKFEEDLEDRLTEDQMDAVERRIKPIALGILIFLNSLHLNIAELSDIMRIIGAVPAYSKVRLTPTVLKYALYGVKNCTQWVDGMGFDASKIDIEAICTDLEFELAQDQMEQDLNSAELEEIMGFAVGLKHSKALSKAFDIVAQKKGKDKRHISPRAISSNERKAIRIHSLGLAKQQQEQKAIKTERKKHQRSVAIVRPRERNTKVGSEEKIRPNTEDEIHATVNIGKSYSKHHWYFPQDKKSATDFHFPGGDGHDFDDDFDYFGEDDCYDAFDDYNEQELNA